MFWNLILLRLFQLSAKCVCLFSRSLAFLCWAPVVSYVNVYVDHSELFWLMSNPPYSCYAFFRLGEYLKRQGTSVSAQHGFCSGSLSSCPPPAAWQMAGTRTRTPTTILSEGTQREFYRVPHLTPGHTHVCAHKKCTVSSCGSACLPGNYLLVCWCLCLDTHSLPPPVFSPAC